MEEGEEREGNGRGGNERGWEGRGGEGRGGGEKGGGGAGRGTNLFFRLVCLILDKRRQEVEKGFGLQHTTRNNITSVSITRHHYDIILHQQ